ncbi:MAG TPA: histidine kinase [Chitinophagaceae bacterium]|nr:histidine kinase [Chitinophagaceae bacterium]
MRFGRRKYWLFQITGWGLFALINVFFAYSFNKMDDAESRRVIFTRLGIFVLLGIVFTHIMRFVIIRLNTLQKTVEKQVIHFLLISLFFALITATFYMEACNRLGLLNEGERRFIDKPLLLILSGAFYFFINIIIWNLIYFIYHYVTKSRRQQLDTLRLEALVKDLELQTIKAHINPHFIFNSLNSIRALIDENPERARKAVTELSNILRSSMQVEKVEMVPFEKELYIVRDYLALENMRFEDRLRIEYRINDNTLEQPVPPMMLQTLVENAIKHGISKQVRGGVVKISSDLRNGFHELVVQNTGTLNGGMNGEDHTQELADKGFGLYSTTNRLNLLYGDKAKFEIRQVNPSLVEAKVLIPLEGEPPNL